ncbi:unnamed protein product [Lymnaea stagnalis]|uniref:BTB domain-containing protein n=1 Tax=Lymnaea stagnalis TaxID=6523 RepID=A0AAV2I8Y9_LYMST
MPLILLEKECGAKCRSRKHVQEIISMIVRGSLREFQAFSNLCYNWNRLTDVFGRSALHVAASCGKTEIVEWLLEEKKVDLTPRDSESGYTALHRALFYGQLSCARLLVQYNCDLQVRDVEGLSPLDIVMLDRPPHVTYSLKEPNEVYTWGENHNSTLGHSSPHKRITPEAVDMFKKSGTSVKQIVLCKYHSVFLSQSGQVYTCGHGHGGRLGHSDQQTVLVPRLLDSVKEHTCLEIAAACDHTVLRMAGGLVYTFGLNSCHQLGQTPFVETSPEPKQMNLKPLKGKSISGVCVGRFHTVVWTPDSVFTVGLNAGQLGHQRGDKHVSTLRQVSYLRHTDIGIARVACSDAATVCLTTKGDVYVLHEYQCKKIASKWQEIEQVLVTGGNLDHTIGFELLTETGGQGLRILMKNESGQLFLWWSSSPSLKRCQFGLKRQLWVSDVAVTSTSLILSTNRGEAFMGYLPNKKLAAVTKDPDVKHSKDFPKDCGDGFSQPRLLDLLLKDEVEEISVRRLPFVHRAVLVSADKKGRNFSVLQALPNGCLSELPSVNSSEINEQFGRLCREADLQDNIHDAVIQVGNRTWPVHQYIIAYRSDHFRNMVAAAGTAPRGEKLVLKVDHVGADIMDQLISFIYTDMCDYLQLGHRVLSQSLTTDERDAPGKSDPVGDDADLIITKGMSAFQIHQKQNSRGGRKEGNKPGQGEVKDESKLSQNPVKMLQEAARRFGVKGLSKRLDAVKCSSHVIMSQGKTLAKPKVTFDRSKLPELYDVAISSEDGEEIQCHKCILVPRLEYFYSMLSTGWVETFNTTTLTLPVSGKVLEILIDFLYSDDAPILRDCTNEELLCNVLVVADQLLATRLKEMCEVALANNIAFKNVGEFLEFSTVYNAQQLKAACQQFICLNLPAVLEARCLDVLSPETMDELTTHYKSVIPNMVYRVVTPDTDGPSQARLDDLVSEFDSVEGDSLIQPADPGSAKKGKQVKKKNKARKSSSDDFEKSPSAGAAPVTIPRVDRAVSQGSDVSLRSEEDAAAVVEELKKQAEEDEKKLLAHAARSKENMKWRPLELAFEKMTPRLSAPTHPEDVPQWNSNYKTLSRPVQQPSGENGSVSTPRGSVPDRSTTSPASPSLMATSPNSLRDIMLQESKSAEKTKSSFSNRISWKDVKKQQSKDSKEKHQKPVSSEWTEKSVVNPSPKAAGNPWASVGGAVKSLRDLMIQEEKIVSAPVAIPAPSAGSPRKPAVTSSVSSSLGSYGKSPPVSLASWGLSKSSGGSAASGVATSTSAPYQASAGSENPWQRRTVIASSPPVTAAQATLNFSAILQDEKEKSETLVRATQKPLALIQLEEQAMNELLSHYKADMDPDRYITVERVSKAMAAPLWHRDARPSGASFL